MRLSFPNNFTKEIVPKARWNEKHILLNVVRLLRNSLVYSYEIFIFSKENKETSSY